MKTKCIHLMVFALIILSDNTNAQIKLNSTGKVKIGTGNPESSYRLTVNGGNTWINGNLDIGLGGTPQPYIKMNTSLILKATLLSYPDYDVGSLGTASNQWGVIYGYSIYANGNYLGSDGRLKENIRDLDNSLDKIMLLRPIKFDFKSPPVPDIPYWREFIFEQNSKNKNRTGFIAQEVLDVIPDVVDYDSSGDKYYIDYNAIIPYLIDAIQEQQLIIKELQTKISLSSEEGSGSTKSNIVTINENLIDQSNSSNSSVLYQNKPNPFNAGTEINLFLPDNAKYANIYLYNIQGKQIKSYNIVDRGFLKIIIQGYELDPGIYLYSLIVDGREIGTKRMTLTE